MSVESISRPKPSFLDLSGELRNKIYGHAMSDTTERRLRPLEQSKIAELTQQGLPVPEVYYTGSIFTLMQTNKKFRQECCNLINSKYDISADTSTSMKDIRAMARFVSKDDNLHIVLGKAMFPESWWGIQGHLRTIFKGCGSLSVSVEVLGGGLWKIPLTGPIAACDELNRMVAVEDPGDKARCSRAMWTRDRILRAFWPLWALKSGY
ncbi:hypothetical protein AC578_10163 [Pseudocercospora eumusae]|uniref:Uncharacterized protein n=1 Tax=Pseudocercospora eumusae TaxID=321146 RepID=A0A139HZ36_9PEZI|nr:hypothetical protein AC578_10163 [Pseudocercospora eumusae]